MNRILEVIIKYIISYIIVVVVFWLLYWIISWGLYGVANLSESRALMTWLGSDFHNEFEPAKHSSLYGEQKIPQTTVVIPDKISLDDPKAKDIANGVEYLNVNNVWVKEEMESIQCLQGLFDELNHYDLDKLLQRDSLIKESRYMQEIIKILHESHRTNSKKHIGETYNHRNEDNKITPRIYINRIKRLYYNHEYEDIPATNGKRLLVVD